MASESQGSGDRVGHGRAASEQKPEGMEGRSLWMPLAENSLSLGAGLS